MSDKETQNFTIGTKIMPMAKLFKQIILTLSAKVYKLKYKEIICQR